MILEPRPWMGGYRMLGNFPQALSHVALVNPARNLTRAAGPAEDRRHA
jgi:GH15 family glucan-1,4-alpha-glucosidase